MGMFDKFKERMAARGPDYQALLEERLPEGETYVAHATVIPAAFEGGGSRGLDAKIVNVVIDAVSAKKHISGEAGSIARSLPTTGAMRLMSVTDKAVAVWDFGPVVTEPSDAPEYTIERSRIASVEDTGQRGQGGTRFLRFTFDDGSTFSYRIFGPGETFFSTFGIPG